jgi:hypothetical protein
MEAMQVGKITVYVDDRLGQLVRIYQEIGQRTGTRMTFDIPVRYPDTGRDGPFDIDMPYDTPIWTKAPDGPIPFGTVHALAAAEERLRDELAEQAATIAIREALGQMVDDNRCPNCKQHEVVPRYEPPQLVMRCPNSDWEEDWTPEAP